MGGKFGRLLLLAGAEALILSILAGCETEDGIRNRERPGSGSTPLSGTIHMAGSTSMEKLTDALAESFMEKYPDVRVVIRYTGSSAGIAAVAEGTADIGLSSRSLGQEERAGGMVENLVALEGIAVCVDARNPVEGLTEEQLAGIYGGKIRNWSQLGGGDLPIVTVGREAGSGTRWAFETYLGMEDQCTYANEMDSAGAVLARVAATPGAVGYLAVDLVTEDVKVLSLEGNVPGGEAVREGSYRIWSPFVMATMGEISGQDMLIQEWFAFVYGQEGREVAEQVGLVAVDPKGWKGGPGDEDGE